MPPLVLFLGKHPLVENYDLSSVHSVICGAAPLAEAQCQEALARLHPGVKLLQGMSAGSTYGLP